MKIDQNQFIPLQNMNSDKMDKVRNLSDEDIEKDILLKKKSRELEAIFLTQLMKVMERTVPKGESEGSDNSLSSMMFSTVMGDSIAESGGIGLSDMLYQALKDRDGSEAQLPGNAQDLYLDNLSSIFNTMIDVKE